MTNERSYIIALHVPYHGQARDGPIYQTRKRTASSGTRRDPREVSWGSWLCVCGGGLSAVLDQLDLAGYTCPTRALEAGLEGKNHL